MTREEKFVNSVLKDKNVEANEQLKDIITRKCMQRMADILKNPTSK